MKTRNLNWMLCFSFVAFLAIQLGCVVGNTPNPSFAYKVPSIKKQLPAEELKGIKEKEPHETKASTSYEERAYSLFEQLYHKSPLLAKELGRIPELQDEVSASDIEALEKIVNLIEDINLPTDFGKRSKASVMKHKIFISWGHEAKERADWGGNFSIGYPGRRMTKSVLETIPYEFETGDKINTEDEYPRRSIEWESTAGAGDIGGIIATIEATKDAELTFRSDNKFTTIPIARLYSGNLTLYDGQVKIGLEKTIASENDAQVDALEDMVLVGGINYNSFLQALFWGYQDNIFNEQNNPLKNYESRIAFIEKAWGDMEGPRWGNFNEVIDRLNTPELIDYYEQNKFSYEYHITMFGDYEPPYWLFKKKKGNCGDFSSFTHYALTKAGYKSSVKFLDLTGNNWGHFITVYEENNKIYVLDNAWYSKLGIIGPFKSEHEILQQYGAVSIKMEF